MANTFEIQTIEDGPRNLVIKLHLDSDGVAGEITGGSVVDVSALSSDPILGPCTEVKLMRVSSAFVGFTAELVWDADTDVHLWEIPDYIQDVCFDKGTYPGIPNNAGTGKTGDVLINTAGFTAATDTGHAFLWFVKKYG